MKKLFLFIFSAAAFLNACTPIVFQQVPAGNYDHRDDHREDRPLENDAPDNFDNSPKTTQLFYDELSPYGTWVDYPDYGYVWVPAVDDDFKPYVSNGSWVYSDFGWTWASNYEWGWATFHYGRWFFDDNYGWVWAPGDEWAPAWVTWGSTGDYYCWAPIPPRVGLEEARQGFWRPQARLWNVVPGQQFTRGNIADFIVFDNQIIKNIRPINNGSNYNRGTIYNGANGFTEYNRGPKLIDIERFTNVPIPTLGIIENRRPGATIIINNQIKVYRPFINRDGQATNGQPSPKKYDSFKGNPNMQRQPADNNGTNSQFNRRQWNGTSGQGQQPDKNTNNGNNQNHPDHPDQNQQRPGQPDNNLKQPASGNNGQDRRPGNTPNNSDNQKQNDNKGQRQPATDPGTKYNNGQSSQPVNPNNQAPAKNFSPPAQPQPVPQQREPKTNPNAGQNPNQQQQQQQQNPVLRPNLQPVHLPNIQKKKIPSPGSKPDTVKRRPNNQ